MDNIIISCFFGRGAGVIQNAHSKIPSYFFSNNSILEPICREKGWQFKYVSNYELIDDYRISSEQSKYIKFLQFLDDFEEFKHYKNSTDKNITYIDHKLIPSDRLLDRVLNLADHSKSLLIRQHICKDKTSLSPEIRDALLQPRYAYSMNKTLEWISKYNPACDIHDPIRIENTGLIYYMNIKSCMDLLTEVHKAVVDLNQPECQILWAVISNKFRDIIQSIPVEKLLWEPIGDKDRCRYWPHIKEVLC